MKWMVFSGFMLVSTIGFSQEPQKSPIEFSLNAGISRHHFYELTDMISTYGTNLSASHSVLSLTAGLNYHLSNEWQVAWLYNPELSTFSSENLLGDVNYTYFMNAVGIQVGYSLVVDPFYVWSVHPGIQYAWYTVSAEGVGAPFRVQVSAGLNYFLETQLLVRRLEGGAYVLTGGIRLKESNPVVYNIRNQEEKTYTFKSTDAYIRIGYNW